MGRSSTSSPEKRERTPPPSSRSCHYASRVARELYPWHDWQIMDKTPSSTVTVGPQGRLVIPSEIRRQMGIGPGDVLLALVEDQRLVLEKREAVLQRLLRRFEHIPAEVSLAEELIAERRSAAVREGES